MNVSIFRKLNSATMELPVINPAESTIPIDHSFGGEVNASGGGSLAHIGKAIILMAISFAAAAGAEDVPPIVQTDVSSDEVSVRLAQARAIIAQERKLLPDRIPRPIVIQRIFKGTFCDRSGIREGDIILACAGERVVDSNNVTEALRHDGSGSTLRIARDTEILTFTNKETRWGMSYQNSWFLDPRYLLHNAQLTDHELDTLIMAIRWADKEPGLSWAALETLPPIDSANQLPRRAVSSFVACRLSAWDRAIWEIKKLREKNLMDGYLRRMGSILAHYRWDMELAHSIYETKDPALLQLAPDSVARMKEYVERNPEGISEPNPEDWNVRSLGGYWRPIGSVTTHQFMRDISQGKKDIPWGVHQPNYQWVAWGPFIKRGRLRFSYSITEDPRRHISENGNITYPEFSLSVIRKNDADMWLKQPGKDRRQTAPLELRLYSGLMEPGRRYWLRYQQVTKSEPVRPYDYGWASHWPTTLRGKPGTRHDMEIRFDDKAIAFWQQKRPVLLLDRKELDYDVPLGFMVTAGFKMMIHQVEMEEWLSHGEEGANFADSYAKESWDRYLNYMAFCPNLSSENELAVLKEMLANRASGSAKDTLLSAALEYRLGNHDDSAALLKKAESLSQKGSKNALLIDHIQKLVEDRKPLYTFKYFESEPGKTPDKEKYFKRKKKDPQRVQYRFSTLNGQICGPATQYDRQGREIGRGTAYLGRKLGFWEHFHSNGKLKSCGRYLNNKKMGIWTYYAENGQKTKEVDYVEIQPGDQFRHGRLKVWLIEQGQISMTGKYKENRRHGDWSWYHPNGQLAERGKFNLGEPVEPGFERWDSKGNKTGVFKNPSEWHLQRRSRESDAQQLPPIEAGADDF